MRLVSAVIARNEGGPDRYLRRVLQNLRAVSDFILLVDDGSEDDTGCIAKEEGAWVVRREGPPMWGQESAARSFLWDQAINAARDFQAWVLFADADMELSADPRPLCATEWHNAWAWRLYDQWGPDVYRADPPWQGHVYPRVWMVNPFRVPADWQPGWLEKGIHCGHIPVNFPFNAAVAPEQYYWRHLGYLSPEHRAKKREQYLSQSHQLTDAERAHAESITDE